MRAIAGPGIMADSLAGQNPAAVRWQWSAFEALEPHSLTALLRLRAAVFVVEQQCIYQDVDGLDERAWHLLGWQDAPTPNAPAVLAAYLRVVFPGDKYAEPSIGRVVVSPDCRGQQLGRALMQQGIVHTLQTYPGAAIRISAQAHLGDFYGSLGFAGCSAQYLEDGIPHIEMLHAAPTLDGSAGLNASPAAD